MINTELSLFLARSEIELNHVHEKLRLLLLLADEDATEDCIDTAENMVNDVRNTAKDAAKQIDSIGGSLWSRMYHIEQEQEKAAKAAAEAEAAKAATTIVVKGNDAAEQAHLNDTLNAWDQAREANAAAEDDDPMGIGAELLKAKAAAAECKGCGCDSEELVDYGCAGCTCSKADEAEGGELNG